MATSPRTTIQSFLGAKVESLLGFHSPKIAKERLHRPGPDFIDRVWAGSDRNIRVLTNVQRIYDHGRKAFQRPLAEGIQLLNAIKDVYLSPEVTVA